MSESRPGRSGKPGVRRPQNRQIPSLEGDGGEQRQDDARAVLSSLQQRRSPPGMASGRAGCTWSVGRGCPLVMEALGSRSAFDRDIDLGMVDEGRQELLDVLEPVGVLWDVDTA